MPQNDNSGKVDVSDVAAVYEALDEGGTPMTDEVERRIRALVRAVQHDEASIGVLSTGEQIAVALVLNRLDLLPPSYPHMLEAVERLGETWTAAALRVQREDGHGGS